jgi:hypothetical protein
MGGMMHLNKGIVATAVAMLALNCNSFVEPAETLMESSSPIFASFYESTNDTMCAAVQDANGQTIESYCPMEHLSLRKLSTLLTSFTDADGWSSGNRFLIGFVDRDSTQDLIVRRASGVFDTFVSNGTSLVFKGSTATSFSDANGWKDGNRFFALDITGDGITDIVARYANGGFAVYRGTGSGTFTYLNSTGGTAFTDAGGWLTGNRFIPLKVSTKDAQGRLITRGALVMRWASGALELWKSNGTNLQYAKACSSPFRDIGGFNDGNRLFAADVDGDGSGDIVARGKNGVFEVRTYDGTCFGWRSSTAPNRFTDSNGFLFGAHFFIGDVTKDGKDDIIVRDDFGALETWRSNGSTLVFDSATTRDTVFVATEGYEDATNRLFSLDLTGDQQPEFLARRSNGKFEAWKFNVSGGAGKACIGQSGTCQVADTKWYQSALNRAQATGKPKVVLSPGIITIGGASGESAALTNTVWPFSPGYVALNVPSKVWLSGATTGGSTLIRTSNRMNKGICTSNSDCPAGQCVASICYPRLGALVAMLDSWHQTGYPDVEVAASGSRVSNLILDGSAGQGDDPFPGPVKEDWKLFADNGVRGVIGKGGIGISNLNIQHVKATAIDGGAMAIGSAESRSDQNNIACNGDVAAGNRYCRSKTYRFSGVPSSRLTISGNIVVDAKFTGIAVVGEFADITSNLVNCTGLGFSGSAGSTMGISAGFGESHDLNIVSNTVYGTDYSIANDGSMPTYINDGRDAGGNENRLLTPWNTIWSELVNFLCEGLKPPSRNCSIYRAAPRSFHADCKDDAGNPVAGRYFICPGRDALWANQLVLDKAAQWTKTNEHSGDDTWGMNYNLTISNNYLRRAIVGLNLWRTHSAWVFNNTIHEPPPHSEATGINLDHSHSNWIYGNTVLSYPNSIRLSGTFEDMNSPFGSSFNGIGVKYDAATGTFPVLGNTLRCSGCTTGVAIRIAGGRNNSVRGNLIDRPHSRFSPGTHCNYAGAQTTTCSQDWTTGNFDQGNVSCNECNATYSSCPW